MTGRLYRGDVAIIALGPQIACCVVRQVSGDRAKVQIGADSPWVFTGELRWDGRCFDGRLPRTEWGWRRLGRRTQATCARPAGRAGVTL